MSDYKKFLDIGIFYIQKGNYSEGIESINKSLGIKNDWEIPYFYRGVASQALNKFDDAILDYTKALTFNENMADAYYNRAYIMLTRKDITNPDYKKIIADLDKALTLDGAFIDALYAMAVARMKIQQYTDSIQYLDKLIAIQPDSINAKALKKLLISKYIK